jgi:D-sedoheptulose 7-phosphate isomerase
MTDNSHGTYIDTYFRETSEILAKLDRKALDAMMQGLTDLRDRQGRLFVVGIGGSAAMATHAVNDFRKIVGIETYSPCDNFAEFSAWANDSGWAEPFVQWLRESNLRKGDGLLVFSVGGGSETTSQNIVTAMEYAKEIGATLFSIVSRDGGKAAQLSDCPVLIPVVEDARITGHAEGMQGVLLHLVVNGIGG